MIAVLSADALSGLLVILLVLLAVFAVIRRRS